VKRFITLQFLNLRQSVRLLGREIRPSQGRYHNQTSKPWLAFEPTTPVFERAKTSSVTLHIYKFHVNKWRSCHYFPFRYRHKKNLCSAFSQPSHARQRTPQSNGAACVDFPRSAHWASLVSAALHDRISRSVISTFFSGLQNQQVTPTDRPTLLSCALNFRKTKMQISFYNPTSSRTWHKTRHAPRGANWVESTYECHVVTVGKHF
jgi:hypothetical protein